MMPPPARRSILAGLISLTASPRAVLAQPLDGFSQTTVQDLARARSLRPWRRPQRAHGPAGDLTYDDYRQIRFRRDRCLWAE